MTSTKGVADVVFCLDASDSMKPCIDGVRTHIGSFLEGLKSDQQRAWDVRFDFVAHFTVKGEEDSIGHAHFSLYHDEPENDVLDNLYLKQGTGRFFTSNIDEFKRGLDKVQVLGDEGPLVALDSCLDFPWRKADECHRVIVFMTDEPFETSSKPEMEKQFLGQIQQKTEDLKILLFIIAPESPAYEELSEVDKSEYEVIESQSSGLADVDFKKLLSSIGKSVSVSTVFQQALHGNKEVNRGLFGQANWGSIGGAVDTSDRT
jgi:hypothetical protein